MRIFEIYIYGHVHNFSIEVTDFLVDFANELTFGIRIIYTDWSEMEHTVLVQNTKKVKWLI